MGSVLEKNSEQVRKRIEKHTFDDEQGDEYEGSEFNGFGDYFRRKKIKLQNLDADLRSNSDKPQIFKGIVAHVTGYTQPPLHILHKEIVQHGGGFLQYLDSKTMATHIIASTLPPKKSVDFSRYRIVKPAWIVDSVQAGKLLPWASYRVLDEGPRQKVLAFDGPTGLSQSTPKPKQGYREQTDQSFYTSQFNAKNLSLPSQSWTQVAEKTNSPSSITPRKQFDGQGTELPGTASSKPVHHTGPDPVLANGKSLLTSPSKAPMTEPPKNATSEEHNAWLLSDPRLRKSSTANPDFLKQYYAESRLHHLSTWKAELKSRMQRLAAEKSLVTTKLPKRSPGSRRYVMHVDFDSFFCAVSLKKRPELVDKPTVIAHSDGPGSEIASCNYPARAFGVKNGMWMKRAQEMCPALVVLPYDFPAYEDASRLFYEAILEVGGIVQSVSIDEALIDVTSVVLAASGSSGAGVDEGSIWREQEKVAEVALKLREKIRASTGCDVSVGIGGNILQAKVALRKAKPAGQFHLKPEAVLDVIGDLKVDDLPGVAYSITGKLEDIGVKFVKDMRDVSRERLSQILGPKTSEKLVGYARGIDKTEVGEQTPRKSVSAEVNWGIRFLSQEEAEEFVMNLCKELEKRLLNEQVKGSQLTMKIMRRSFDAPLDPPKHLGHGKCDVFNKSTTFGVSTNDAERIGKEAVSILRSYKFSAGDLRGLGVQMTKLEPLKAALPDGSQKRLAFETWKGTSPARASSRTETIMESDNADASSKRLSKQDMSDPIADDPLTPRKPKMHPSRSLSKFAQKDEASRTPLNVSGTQFILPSQVDASTLAELPNDIRSRLIGQGCRPATRSASPAPKPESESPMPVDVLPSQVDAEVFNSLPEDMKAEVLASYGRKPQQVALQQSPRKNQVAQQKKATTTKRGGIRGMFGKGQRQKDAQSGLVQTNFLAAKPVAAGVQPDEGIEELDPSFLAELPEDVRKEVIADHRRQRMAQRAGLDAPAPRPHHTDAQALLAGGQTTIQFPAPPPKVSFAQSGVTSTQEIKDMLDAWHTETKSQGPHSGDVEVLGKYLARVVQEERDLEKARKIVKWLDIVVEHDGLKGRGRSVWRQAVSHVKLAVQGAVKERGMAPVKF
ncbi:hypothetical protein NLU13_2143 [Sarocladium strictum]|uniref:DNA repair protein REV1 n=1 Tax=Sarocladium strictum TaxID=5046 RepID=A0AA39GS97_SARSR|nr:hypothetical protein NLU13_2143 [Sarocladium strictum]